VSARVLEASEVRQQALSLVLEVRPGEGEALAGRLRERRRAVEQALARVTTLHFGRFVVLPPPENASWRGAAVGRDWRSLGSGPTSTAMEA